ncbi:NAD(P)/FAD-dependent oxidoreductase [Acerihabitans arboris]|uniref:FAD-dependent oxidoreductase n=1 Tax=Acerihabitans arboris TaxID=2691583 RepID=A0A845SET5_9GAMM|nr:FAD-binding oxidoreductase [Acerihabitans arboris]NDL61596.1 FAD-dependent oxidoreductase [Acerihabitans arboris]
MGPNVDLVVSSSGFPRETEVVVIGGGIVGAATALSLVERGIPTVLLEKGLVGAEQSSRNWGWCRRTGRDVRELPLINLSMQLWDGMNARLGSDTGFRITGIAYAARSEEQWQRQQRWLEEARQYGIHSDALTSAQLRQKLPDIDFPVQGALYTALDGRAEPQKAAPAMVAAAVAKGLNLQQHCAVRTIEQTAGKVGEVATERGAIRCRAVVVAGGAWSRLLLQGCGVTLPQLKVLSTAFRTAPTDYDPGCCISFGLVSLRKRLDGGLTVASSSNGIADITPDSLRFGARFMPAYRAERQGIRLRLGQRFSEELFHWRPGRADKISIYERIRVLDPAIDARIVRKVAANLARVIPALAGVSIEQSWGGLIDSMPDAIPVISPVAPVSGLYLATGFSGHGFGIGPGAGQLMADLVTGSPPSVDPHPFRLARFTDGERIAAQHWL